MCVYFAGLIIFFWNIGIEKFDWIWNLFLLLKEILIFILVKENKKEEFLDFLKIILIVVNVWMVVKNWF